MMMIMMMMMMMMMMMIMMMVTMMNILRPINLLFNGYQGLFPRVTVFC